MKVASYIASKVSRMPSGRIFTSSALMKDKVHKEAAIKALNRMVNAGTLAKYGRGKFYKPEYSPFGLLSPDVEQVISDLLYRDGKIRGYITGYSIYNRMGLTTQLSFVIQIGCNHVRPTFKRGQFRISFIRQPNRITKERIPLMQILDAIRYIKIIPDSTAEQSCKRLKVVIKNLADGQIAVLVRLSLLYPPYTRAILGSMLEDLGENDYLPVLYDSLNPLTRYKFYDLSKSLESAKKWNIV